MFNDKRVVDYRRTTTMLSRNLELFNSGIVQQQQTPTTLPDLSHLKSPSIDRSAAGMMTILRIVNISFWILAAATLPLSLFSLAMRLACWSFLNRDWMIHLIATYPFQSVHTCREKNKTLDHFNSILCQEKKRIL